MYKLTKYDKVIPVTAGHVGQHDCLALGQGANGEPQLLRSVLEIVDSHDRKGNVIARTFKLGFPQRGETERTERFAVGDIVQLGGNVQPRKAEPAKPAKVAKPAKAERKPEPVKAPDTAWADRNAQRLASLAKAREAKRAKAEAKRNLAQAAAETAQAPPMAKTDSLAKARAVKAAKAAERKAERDKRLSEAERKVAPVAAAAPVKAAPSKLADKLAVKLEERLGDRLDKALDSALDSMLDKALDRLFG